MAAAPQPFWFSVTNNGQPQAGLAPVFLTLNTGNGTGAGTPVTKPTIFDDGGGAYVFQYDPETTGDAAGWIDAGATVANPGERYQLAVMTRGPVRAVLSLPSAAPGTPGGLDTPISEAGTMQAGSTATTSVLRSGASATNKIYDGGTIQILSGTGVGQARTIAYYNGATKTVTIAGSWAVTPDNTSQYAIRMGNTPILDATGDLLAAGGTTTVTLAAGASATNSIYVGALLVVVAGTGAGQSRTMTGYVGGTQVATVDQAFTPALDTTSVYRIRLAEQAALNSSLQPTAASVATPVTVTGITPSIMQQLSALAGSSSVTGNVITYVSQDGAHHFTQTFVPSIAAPTSIVWAQVD